MQAMTASEAIAIRLINLAPMMFQREFGGDGGVRVQRMCFK